MQNLLVDFRRAMNKVMVPKFIFRILNQFNKGDQESPRMWAIYDETFKKYTSYLLLKILEISIDLCCRFSEVKLAFLPE